ncbi:TPA: DUF4393 domain-containing protein, partial [Staphylococcus aureus]|nr:DUF4393 domain-containing protein [Staphylococcus aureus]
LYESFDDPKIINNYIQKYEKETYKKVLDVFNMINHFGIENISRYYNLSINEVYTIVKPACIEYDKGYIEITSFGKAFAKCCF